jgi:hypothetical protein
LHPKRFDHVQSLTFQQLDQIRIGGRTPENGKLFARERQIVNTKNKKAGPYGKKRGIQKGRMTAAGRRPPQPAGGPPQKTAAGRRPQAAGHPNLQAGHPKNGRKSILEEWLLYPQSAATPNISGFLILLYKPAVVVGMRNSLSPWGQGKLDGPNESRRIKSGKGGGEGGRGRKREEGKGVGEGGES